MPETEPKQVEELAAAIHKARTLTLPCPDNYDEDLDAWCWEAARIVLALGWVSPEEHAAAIDDLHEGVDQVNRVSALAADLQRRGDIEGARLIFAALNGERA